MKKPTLNHDMKLSEQLKRARADRPDEWSMDRYIQKAKEMEDLLENNRNKKPIAWFHDDFGVVELSRIERKGWKPLFSPQNDKSPSTGATE